MEVKKVKLTQVALNERNPRTITEVKLLKLVESILVFPRMMEQRPIVIDEAFMALGGNMRLKALTQISSFAIQKAIRRNNKQFIAVTCHYDVQDWLMPDWVFNTDTMTFQTIDAETQKKNRPPINIEIREVRNNKAEIWRIFSKYHYLSYSFNTAARAFVCYANGNLAGFTSALPFPHPKKKNTMKLHRTVVFPDYQGVGIAGALQNEVAEYLSKNGKTVISTMSHPAMIVAHIRDKKWVMTRHSRSSSGKIQNKYVKGSTSCARITCSFEYIGGSVRNAQDARKKKKRLTTRQKQENAAGVISK